MHWAHLVHRILLSNRFLLQYTLKSSTTRSYFQSSSPVSYSRKLLPGIYYFIPPSHFQNIYCKWSSKKQTTSCYSPVPNPPKTPDCTAIIPLLTMSTRSDLIPSPATSTVPLCTTVLNAHHWSLLSVLLSKLPATQNLHTLIPLPGTPFSPS
jgi:hypothetical protein